MRGSLVRYIEKDFNRKKNSTELLKKSMLDGTRTLRHVHHIDPADMEFKNAMKMSEGGAAGIRLAAHVA